jgi:hypothetical protein
MMTVGRLTSKTPPIDGWDSPGVCSDCCSDFWLLTASRVSALEAAAAVVCSELGEVELPALDGGRQTVHRIADPQSASCPAAHLN